MFTITISDDRVTLYHRHSSGEPGSPVVETACEDPNDPFQMTRALIVMFDSMMKTVLEEKHCFRFSEIESAIAPLERLFPGISEYCDHIVTEGFVPGIGETPRSIESMMTYTLSMLIVFLYTRRSTADIWNVRPSDRMCVLYIMDTMEKMVGDIVEHDRILETIITSNFNRYVKSTITRSESFSMSKPLMDYGMPALLATTVSNIINQKNRSERFSSLSNILLEPSQRTSFQTSVPDGFIAAGCSYSGFKHLGNGNGCEDYCGFHTGTGMIAMAVADGVSGSGTKTAIGSECATRAFFDLMEDYCGKVEETLSYSDVRRIFKTGFVKDFYSKWVDYLKEYEGDVEIEPNKYTTTFLGLVRAGYWIVTYKIGNGHYIISDGQTSASSISINDNCKEPLITASMSKSPSNPDWWCIRIIPAEEVSSVLMCSDGADNILTGETIPYNNLLNNCPMGSPNYIRFIDEWSSIEDPEELYSVITKTASDLSVAPSMYGGDPIYGDDITMAFIRFRE